jgi:predicted MFS family arabinose efflux permease
MFFLMVQYLEDQLGYGPMTTGLAFLPMPLSVFVMSRFSPRLVGRFGPLPLVITGTAAMTLAFLRLSMLDSGSAYWTGVFPSLLVMGLAGGLSFMPITALVLRGVEPEHAGAASGLLQTMQQLGGSVGLAVIASVFAANAADADFLAGADAGFLTAAVLTAIAMVSALTVAVRRPRTVPVAALD